LYKNNSIGVVIPAYNEEIFIRDVIETLPTFVDKIFVVNDGSTDGTGSILSSIVDERLVIITHEKKMGAGAATISGYQKACESEIDIITTMDGDGQMDPAILDTILDPVVDDRADYAKGDRLSTFEDRKVMPKFRYLGNSLLTLLTRVASGYWSMSDPQCGYTAISRTMLQRMDLSSLHKGWPFLNDILIKLHVVGARLISVHHRAQYGEEQSKINYSDFIATTSWLLLRGYLWRIWTEYVRRPDNIVSR
jgi:glycosyltransferase involved in cell wall biosynthesis